MCFATEPRALAKLRLLLDYHLCTKMQSINTIWPLTSLPSAGKQALHCTQQTYHWSFLAPWQRLSLMLQAQLCVWPLSPPLSSSPSSNLAQTHIMAAPYCTLLLRLFWEHQRSWCMLCKFRKFISRSLDSEWQCFWWELKNRIDCSANYLLTLLVGLLALVLQVVKRDNRL